VASAVATSATALVAVGFVLGPTTPPGRTIDEVQLVRVERLQEDVPLKLIVPELTGLDQKARAKRSGGSYTMGIARANRVEELAVYVVRSAEGVRAFIGVDPRNGCGLEFWPADVITHEPDGRTRQPSTFHDVCHGSLYDLNGNKVGGPSPWTLDELVVALRDGRVYASTREVLPGRWIAQRY